jgi:hypothetical protein
MNWLHYLLEANLYLSIFYIGYCFVLNKETYYTLNRAYLLLTCVLAFILPLMQIGALKQQSPVLHVVFTVISNNTIQQPVINTMAHKQAANFNWQNDIVYLYLFGATVSLLLLLSKLFRLLLLIRGTAVNAKQYKLIPVSGSNTAFSFFGYLFIGTNNIANETIIRHELVHIRQKHSADIIFIELLKVINWFNPFIYFILISLKAVHEYIADEKTIGGADVSAYSTFLVNNAYGVSGPSISHSFFNYNLLKKRIIMLHQKRSGSLARLKYLVAVPICAALLCSSTLAFSKTYGFIDLLPKKADTAKTPLPPPPAPPKPVAAHRPAPPVQAVTNIILLPPTKPVSHKDHGLRYAPPLLNNYLGLDNFLNKNLAYPEDAFNKRIIGNVVVKFTLNAQHKITDVQPVTNLGHGLEDEVTGMVQSYNGIIKGNRPYYIVMVSFNLVGNSTKLMASDFEEKYLNSPDYACALVINGDIK